jgi:hypothetical protein
MCCLDKESNLLLVSFVSLLTDWPLLPHAGEYPRAHPPGTVRLSFADGVSSFLCDLPSFAPTKLHCCMYECSMPQNVLFFWHDHAILEIEHDVVTAMGSSEP